MGQKIELKEGAAEGRLSGCASVSRVFLRELTQTVKVHAMVLFLWRRFQESLYASRGEIVKAAENSMN
jgi:hypothetical protein